MTVSGGRLLVDPSLRGRRIDEGQLDPSSRSRLIALGRERFDVFAKIALKIVEGIDPVSEPYLESLCFELDEVLYGDTKRLLINMPPRHLKSFCMAIALPAFALGHDPSFDIAVATYNQELGREHTEKFRKLINSRMYKTLFPGVRIASDRIDKISTTRNGGRRAVTVGGAFTGMGADIILLDDLLKSQDVAHQAMRDTVLRFFQEVVLTRLNDQRSGRIIIALQRLHALDIAADLIEKGQYRHLNLPSIAPRDQTLRLYNGRTRLLRAGDLLSPVRFPQETLDQLRLEMGTQAFSAQYLQEPLPPGAMLIDMKRVQWTERPFERTSLQYVVQSIDTAVTVTDRSDYTVIMTFGWDGECWCILNVVRGRYDYAMLKQAAIQQSSDWGADRVIIEGGHIGSALWSDLKGRVRRGMTIPPNGSKEERLAASTEVLYSGGVLIPRNESWSEVFRDELRTFPGGRHDDMVDALTQFVGWQRGRNMERTIASRDARHGRRPRAA